jgi:hypothetical protein
MKDFTSYKPNSHMSEIIKAGLLHYCNNPNVSKVVVHNVSEYKDKTVISLEVYVKSNGKEDIIFKNLEIK